MDNLGFITRFKEVLSDNEMSASTLADEIDVQRSSISHIISGRNKPSLDFILKLVKRFPNIDMYWLVNGTKNKFVDKAQTNSNTTPISVNNKNNVDKLVNEDIDTINSETKKIKNIVIFYEDGTFEKYSPN